MESLFKIVYQNGEFVSDESTFLGVSIDTIFTVLTTIGIFVAGYVWNRMIEANKEKERLAELKEYFEKLVELLNTPITKQRNEWVKLSRKLKEQKEQHTNLADITMVEVNLIKQIDSKDLFNIYYRGKKGDKLENSNRFGKLISKLDHILEIKKYVLPNFNEMRARLEKYEYDYKTNAQVTSELFDSMVEAYPGGAVPVTDIFLITLNNIRVAWVALSEGGTSHLDMYVSREHYLNPVRDLCRVHIATGDPRALRMLKYVSNCLHALDNTDEVKYVYRRHFLGDARSIQTCMIEIRKSITYLNNAS